MIKICFYRSCFISFLSRHTQNEADPPLAIFSRWKVTLNINMGTHRKDWTHSSNTDLVGKGGGGHGQEARKSDEALYSTSVFGKKNTFGTGGDHRFNISFAPSAIRWFWCWIQISLWAASSAAILTFLFVSFGIDIAKAFSTAFRFVGVRDSRRMLFVLLSVRKVVLIKR